MMKIYVINTCEYSISEEFQLSPFCCFPTYSLSKMINSGNQIPGHRPPETLETTAPTTAMDPILPLMNLSLLLNRMDSLRRSLSASITRRNAPIADDQIRFAASEISSAVHHIVFNAAALISASHHRIGSDPIQKESKVSNFDPNRGSGSGSRSGSDSTVEIVEVDAVELLTDRVHLCEICGKGFKRDANLRMHMRAHGNQYKTLEALTKPSSSYPNPNPNLLRFSCPFEGCSKNRNHKKFRPLKSAACVKHHFKRSHCKKMHSCDKCGKQFSVLGDMRSHFKNCGGEERRWRCSCGTSFARKDKLFGHVALFEGHSPAVDIKEELNAGVDDDEKEEGEEEEEENDRGKGLDTDFFDGLMEEIGGFSDWV